MSSSVEQQIACVKREIALRERCYPSWVSKKKMSQSLATYEQVALEDSDEQWELVCGRLRAKPAMTFAHNRVMRVLSRQLMLEGSYLSVGQA